MNKTWFLICSVEIYRVINVLNCIPINSCKCFQRMKKCKAQYYYNTTGVIKWVKNLIAIKTCGESLKFSLAKSNPPWGFPLEFPWESYRIIKINLLLTLIGVESINKIHCQWNHPISPQLWKEADTLLKKTRTKKCSFLHILFLELCLFSSK